MSSAICFNLDQSKILSSGNGLKAFSIRRNLCSYSAAISGTVRHVCTKMTIVSYNKDEMGYELIPSQ